MEITDVRYLLFYAYVEGMLERREPHRADHLRRIDAERATGHIVFSGPFDPPTGALIGFTDVGAEHVEAFAAGDPYSQAGLITSWHVERFNGR